MLNAHSLPDDPDDPDKSRWQSLAGHLNGVSRLSGCRGAKFRAERAAGLAGLLHDLGKYTREFQARLEGGERVDHATAGAREIIELASQAEDRCMAAIIAHAIAGHHTGMPDSVGDPSLDTRLKNKRLPALDPAWREEITPVAEGLTPAGFSWRADTRARQLAFFGRMIFSCLVDADYRDTEEFYAAAKGEKVDRDWPGLPENVDDYIERFDRYMAKKPKNDTRVNALRAEILVHVRARAPAERGLFTLTVPTGGGKTLASLAFALDHAKRYRLERIVYAIPFTSIIDQTAAIFREVLGDDVVLEHHSSIDEERIDNEDKKHKREAADKLKLAMEDWAAPVVVTTNVQLFESLHSNRPSRCRKLHNLANAVIVLDEAQTIPLHVLRPCLAAIEELARNYGTSVVLCTATQPAVAAPDFPGGLTLGKERELAPEPARLHELKRVRLEHLGERTDEQILSELRESEQGLVIVNSRAHALALYKVAKDAGLDGVVHLTTRQYAAHRRRILDDVRQRLTDGAPCRLIATSLVEAGVDLDFPRVWRAEAGLDQIAQAAGRCNREGVRPVEESVVGVFRSPEHKPPREIAQLAGDMGRMMGKHADLLSPDAMRDYFGEVYWRKGDELDKHKIGKSWGLPRSTRGPGLAPSFAYRTVAENFRMIESGLAPVIVARENEPREAPACAALAALAGGRPPGKVAREIQSYIVQVPPKARDLLLKNGHVRFVEGFGDQFAVMENGSLYCDEIGLLWEQANYLGLDII